MLRDPLEYVSKGSACIEAVDETNDMNLSPQLTWVIHTYCSLSRQLVVLNH
jgi:hypothetical protein